jgi:hypothetical protein
MGEECEVADTYNLASRIIYEWGTCTGAIRRLRFEIVNVEIMQHVFVVKYFCCYGYGICIRDLCVRSYLALHVDR